MDTGISQPNFRAKIISGIAIGAIRKTTTISICQVSVPDVEGHPEKLSIARIGILSSSQVDFLNVTV